MTQAELIEDGIFRKGQFFLSPASNPGQQIADFYASSSRNFFLGDGTGNLSSPYELSSQRSEYAAIP